MLNLALGPLFADFSSGGRQGFSSSSSGRSCGEGPVVQGEAVKYSLQPQNLREHQKLSDQDK